MGMEKEVDTINRLRDVSMSNSFRGSCEFGKNDGSSNSEGGKQIVNDGTSPLIEWCYPHDHNITDIEVPNKGGRRTQKQNDSNHLGLMIGGWDLPSSPSHQLFRM